MTYRDGGFPSTDRLHARTGEQTMLDHAVHSSVAAIVVTDINGVIEYSNPAFGQLTGYEPEQLHGRHTRVLSSGMQDRAFYGALWSTIRAGKLWSGELRNRRKDGTLFWASLSISPVVLGGKVVKFIATAVDITAQKHMQEELRAAEERAKKAMALKDAFLATISHEIRTPMNVILGFSDLLEQQYGQLIEAPDHFYFQSIREASQRLIRTLDLMVNVSSAVSGNYVPVFEEYDVVDGMEGLVQQFAPAAHEKRLFLEFRPSERSARVRLDRYAFEQSMQNLLDNAIRFTHDGGVFVTMRRRKFTVCIDIHDTGEGMSQEFLSRIFEPFNQEDSGLGRRYEGLGLGLSLTRRYIELCHGNITVTSEKRRGTHFTVCLPCAG